VTLATAGYIYGTAHVAQSPVSMVEFERLKGAVGFTDEDERYLRLAGEFLPGMVEDVLEHWFSLFGPLFVSYFVGPDGKPIERYLEAAHGRFVRWFHDTCLRPYDQDWLNYQHEIGLRHHRSKKNKTDKVESVPVVHQRYLTALIYPMSRIRPFLERGGHGPDEVDKMQQAWTKSLILQVALWSQPYVREGDW
jgi:hypothetical protein